MWRLHGDLSYQLPYSGTGGVSSSRKYHCRFPFVLSSWLCAAIVAVFLQTAPAAAHHFKGLPHFNYFENYPQIPQEEFLGQEGSYEFSLVLYDFQGLQTRDMLRPDDARLFLIAFDLLRNKVYSGPARLEVLDGGVAIISEDVDGPREENVYQLHRTLPPDGDYSFRITLLDEKLTAVIPFQLTSQKVNWGTWVAAVLAALIAIAAVGARRARVLQDRKMNVS